MHVHIEWKHSIQVTGCTILQVYDVTGVVERKTERKKEWKTPEAMEKCKMRVVSGGMYIIIVMYQYRILPIFPINWYWVRISTNNQYRPSITSTFKYLTLSMKNSVLLMLMDIEKTLKEIIIIRDDVITY